MMRFKYQYEYVDYDLAIQGLVDASLHENSLDAIAYAAFDDKIYGPLIDEDIDINDQEANQT